MLVDKIVKNRYVWIAEITFAMDPGGRFSADILIVKKAA